MELQKKIYMKKDEDITIKIKGFEKIKQTR